MSNTLEKAINPIKRHTIADGYLDVLIDLEKSKGPYIYNKFNDKNYLEYYSISNKKMLRTTFLLK